MTDRLLILGVCRIDGCERPARKGRRTCSACEHAIGRYGDPFKRGDRTRPRAKQPPIDRFMQYVTVASNGCWLWTGSCNHGGYGKFWHNGFTIAAHRWIYENVHGPIPNGLTIDHLCRIRHCVNPAHLESVSMRENIMRGNTVSAKNAAKTECLRGHPFDEVNTYWWRGERQCRRCAADRYLARKAA